MDGAGIEGCRVIPFGQPFGLLGRNDGCYMTLPDVYTFMDSAASTVDRVVFKSGYDGDPKDRFLMLPNISFSIIWFILPSMSLVLPFPFGLYLGKLTNLVFWDSNDKAHIDSPF